MNREQYLTGLLQRTFNPIFLEVINESSLHHVPENSETHFKVTVVSNSFQAKSRIERHRELNKLLADQFDLGLHALSLHLYTPEEWEKAGGKTGQSPVCKGGYRHG
ncbi:BolA family protein [Legionella dresdenensis]|uniref:BolA family protein n=1 Tax=Legionella dresdenensis TaxID=450200 RepID=A0ABV8CHL6_9GAMM